VRGVFGLFERGKGRLRVQAAHCYTCDDQFVSGPESGRKGRGVKFGECVLSLVKAPDQ
jgi:hypothetical protein